MESNDTCKWIRVTGPDLVGRQLFNTYCGHHLREKFNNDYVFKYCPYCGLEIEESKYEN